MPYTTEQSAAIIGTPSRFQKPRDFENVVSGSTAICKLPVKGPFYRHLTIRVAHASIIDEVTLATAAPNFRLKINGQIVQEWATVDFFAVQKFLGQTITASGGVGFIHLPLSDVTQRLINAEQTFGIGTVGLDQLTLEVDLGVAVTSLRVYTGHATIADPQLQGLTPPAGQFIQTTIQREGAVGIGVYDINDLVDQRGDLFRLILKESVPGAITDVKLTFRDAIIYEAPVDVMNEIYRKEGARVPQSGYVILDPGYQGYASHSLGIGNAGYHKLELTLGAGANIDIIMQTIDERF